MSLPSLTMPIETVSPMEKVLSKEINCVEEFTVFFKSSFPDNETIKSFFCNLFITGELSSSPTTKTPSPSDLTLYPNEFRATAIATFSEVCIFCRLI